MRAALLATTILVLASTATASARRFDLGVEDPIIASLGVEHDPAGAYSAARRENFRYVRVALPWATAAPTKPRDAADPSDPAYDWSATDARIQMIRSHGMEPLVYLYAPPEWAWRRHADGKRFRAPRLADFRRFARAAARHYDGRDGRARVRYWEIWNEPNLTVYFDGTPADYRAVVNAGTGAIHGVHRDNLVAAGSLAPFGDPSQGYFAFDFMRGVLCMSADAVPQPTCGARIDMDAWSVHPYTAGAPTHESSNPGYLSLGDLPETRRLLRGAEKAGHMAGRQHVGFWVTEFAWDTKPPDPGGVPLARHARWVAEALYRAWQQGVTVFFWFGLRDNPDHGSPGSTYQDGLYARTQERYAGERRKPFAQVIRFPFAAVPDGNRVAIWGRTPDARAATVTVERQDGSRWRRLLRIRAAAGGVFVHRSSVAAGMVLRARVGRAISRPYQAVPNEDVPVNPFGGSAP